jgi:hypothetical protein
MESLAYEASRQFGYARIVADPWQTIGVQRLRDRRMDARIVESTMRGGQPDTLTSAEITSARNGSLARTPVARTVRAWVRYGGVPLLIDAGRSRGPSTPSRFAGGRPRVNIERGLGFRGQSTMIR